MFAIDGNLWTLIEVENFLGGLKKNEYFDGLNLNLKTVTNQYKFRQGVLEI